MLLEITVDKGYTNFARLNHTDTREYRAVSFVGSKSTTAYLTVQATQLTVRKQVRNSARQLCVVRYMRRTFYACFEKP
eukprot:9503907-Pyramimonas_sp.AAC.1